MKLKIEDRRYKRNCIITCNGIKYELGNVIPSTAVKKAHHIVRDRLKNEYNEYKGFCQSIKVTAEVSSYGEVLATVYGVKKTLSNIQIVHFSA